MSAENTESVATPAVQPPIGADSRFLGRPWSFWRAAVAAGMASAAVGIISWRVPDMHQPGALALLLIASALLIAGPPRALENHARRDAFFVWCAGIGLSLAPTYSLAFSSEPEAALLTTPMWFLIPAFLLLGWRLRQQDSDLPALTLCFIGIFRIIFNSTDPMFRTGEMIWWLGTFLWCGFLMFASARKSHPAHETAPLLGGCLWFVIAVVGLTIQEFRYPLIHLVRDDVHSAIGLLMKKPLFGWGLGSFPLVMREFALRNPALGEFATPGYLRLAGEIGLIPIAMIATGFVGGLIRLVPRRPWNRGRFMVLGALGFWVLALLSGRGVCYIPLAIVALLVAPSAGQPPLRRDEKNNPIIPPFALQSWVLCLALLLIPCIIFPAARWHYKSRYKDAPLVAQSFLHAWTYPLQYRAWTIRDRSHEIMQYADPRDYLKPVVQEWIAAAPHSELAQIERLRWAHRTLPARERESIARDAHDRLPWSDAVAGWVVRILSDNGQHNEAIAFLEDQAAERGPLHPALQTRLRALKSQRQNNSSEKPNE